MAPTLIGCDSFEHQQFSTNTFAVGGTAYYTSLTGMAVDTTNQRTGSACAKCAPTVSTAAQFRHGIAAGNRKGTVSFYFKFDTTASLPSADIVNIFSPAGPANTPQLFWQQSTGKFAVKVTGGSTVALGPVLSRGVWYLVDVKFDVSTATFSMTAQVDGDGATEGSTSAGGKTAADWTASFYGTSSTTGPAGTFYIDDVVWSATDTDYPIGAHQVKSLLPTADGTSVPGTVIQDEASNTINGTTHTAWDHIKDIPIGNTHYIKQTGAGTGNYAEIAFADPAAADSTIWVVTAATALEGASANAADLIFRTVDSGGTTLTDQGGTGAVSGTTRRFSRAVIAVPSGGSWDNTKLSGVKGRVGFASDVSPVPRGLVFFLEYAGPTVSTVTQSADAIILKTATVSHSTDASIQPAPRTHSTDAIIKKTTTVTQSADAIVLKTASVSQSSDAIIRKTSSIAHSTDAIIKATLSRAHSTDAVAQKTLSQVHSTDSVVRATLAVAQSADAYIATGTTTGSATHSTDALILRTGSATHATDAVTRATFSVAQSTDALIRKTLSVAHSTDTVARATLAVTHSTDALIYLRSTLAHSTDAAVRKTLSRAHLTDAITQRTTARSHATDAVARKTLAVSHSTDALVSGVLAHTSDAIILRTSTATHSTDAVIAAPRFIEHSTDAYIVERLTATHGTDAHVVQWKFYYRKTESDVFLNEDWPEEIFVRPL